MDIFFMTPPQGIIILPTLPHSNFALNQHTSLECEPSFNMHVNSSTLLFYTHCNSACVVIHSLSPLFWFYGFIVVEHVKTYIFLLVVNLHGCETIACWIFSPRKKKKGSHGNTNVSPFRYIFKCILMLLCILILF